MGYKENRHGSRRALSEKHSSGKGGRWRDRDDQIISIVKMENQIDKLMFRHVKNDLHNHKEQNLEWAGMCTGRFHFCSPLNLFRFPADRKVLHIFQKISPQLTTAGNAPHICRYAYESLKHLSIQSKLIIKLTSNGYYFHDLTHTHIHTHTSFIWLLVWVH